MAPICMQDAAGTWKASQGIAEISKSCIMYRKERQKLACLIANLKVWIGDALVDGFGVDWGWIGQWIWGGLGVDWGGLGWIGPGSLSRGARKTWELHKLRKSKTPGAGFLYNIKG